MTTLWWVRHGPTHQKTITGWRDVPADLTDSDALARLDAALPRNALLVSSDLCRATATADCLAAGRQRLPDQPGLREFDFGAWDGLDFTQAMQRDPDLTRRFWAEPGEVAPPRGESWNAVSARVSACVAALTAAHPGAQIVAVAHFGVILTQIAAARGEPPAKTIGQRIEPLSLTRIALGPRPSVYEINHRA